MPNGTQTELQCDKLAAINSEVLFKNCLGSGAFALTLLEELELSGKQYVDSIARHLSSANSKATGAAAHSLKGAAGIVGAELLRSLASQIELASEMADTDSIAPLVFRLGEEMERCLAQIPAIRLQARDSGREGI